MSITTGAIDLTQPVNRGCGLNTGLVVWYLAFPHGPYYGGARMMDLCGTYHGTLTNGPVWEGARGRLGGSAALLHDGTDDYIATSASYTLLGSQYTVSAWVRDSNVGTGTYVAIGDHALININGTSFRWQYDTGAFPFVTGTTAARAAGEWHHFVVVHRDTGASGTDLYHNAVSVGNGAAMSQALTAGTFRLGQQDPVEVGRYLVGSIDDVRGYNRALTASEVARLYEDSRLGYPQTLNRLRGYVGLDIGIGGGGGGDAVPVCWAQYRRRRAA